VKPHVPPRQQVAWMTGAGTAAEVVGNFPLHQRCPCLWRRVSPATEQAAPRTSPQAGAPKGRRDCRVVTGVGEEVNSHPVRFHFDLAVESLILSELAEKTLLDPCRFQSASMLQHQMSELMSEYGRQLQIAGGGGEPVIYLNDAPVGAGFERVRCLDFDQRLATGGRRQDGFESSAAANKL